MLHAWACIGAGSDAGGGSVSIDQDSVNPVSAAGTLLGVFKILRRICLKVHGVASRGIRLNHCFQVLKVHRVFCIHAQLLK